MNVWGALMVIAGGLFAGGAATFAWSRGPIWRRMTMTTFVDDFSPTIRKTDQVQPALLVLAIAGAVGFAANSQGIARVLTILGGAGFAAVLAGSVAVMVPLQRRIINEPEQEGVEGMRQRWFRANLGRASLSVLAFAAAACAAVVV